MAKKNCWRVYPLVETSRTYVVLGRIDAMEIVIIAKYVFKLELLVVYIDRSLQRLKLF